MTKDSKWMAWILLAVLSLIWGSSFILIKKGLIAFASDEVGALRILSASVFLSPIAIYNLRKIEKHQWLLLFSVGMFGSFLPAFLFAKAQTQIPSSVAGILNALTPLFTMLIGIIIFQQKTTWKTALGLLIGFIGTVFLITAGKNGLNFNVYGLFVVLATIFYGANLNLIKFKIPDLNARTITSISLLIVGPVSAIYLFGFTDFITHMQTHPVAVMSFGAVVLLGVMGTAIALILFNQLVKITTPIFTSSVTYFIPIVAVIWGLVDHENLFLEHYIGMTAIILGVYLTNRKKRVVVPAK